MTIKILNLGFAGVLLRFYLLMAVVILAGFTGFWALGLLALPIFVSALLGVSIGPKEKALSTAPVITMTQKQQQKAS